MHDCSLFGSALLFAHIVPVYPYTLAASSETWSARFPLWAVLIGIGRTAFDTKPSTVFKLRLKREWHVRQCLEKLRHEVVHANLVHYEPGRRVTEIKPRSEHDS